MFLTGSNAREFMQVVTMCTEWRRSLPQVKRIGTTDWKVLLEWILKCGQDLFGTGQERVADSCDTTTNFRVP
jgi:hypothetical protein